MKNEKGTRRRKGISKIEKEEEKRKRRWKIE